MHHATRRRRHRGARSARSRRPWARSQSAIAPASWTAAVSPGKSHVPGRSRSSRRPGGLPPPAGPDARGWHPPGRRSQRPLRGRTTMRSVAGSRPCSHRLQFDRISVGWECRGVDEDRRLQAGRPEERRQQEVQVDGQGVERRPHPAAPPRASPSTRGWPHRHQSTIACRRASRRHRGAPASSSISTSARAAAGWAPQRVAGQVDLVRPVRGGQREKRSR